jgi:hypothetical protein
MVLNVYKGTAGFVITIVIPFREMQERVLEESSHFAARQRDREGNVLFEEFVFDEGYETKFRSYFYSAQGELTEYLSAYLKFMPTASELIETDKAGREDWVMQLLMPCAFNEALAGPVGFKIEDFVENYIMYRWLETKSPEAATVYMATSNKLKSEINANLNKRSCSVERPNGYWF